MRQSFPILKEGNVNAFPPLLVVRQIAIKGQVIFLFRSYFCFLFLFILHFVVKAAQNLVARKLKPMSGVIFLKKV